MPDARCWRRSSCNAGCTNTMRNSVNRMAWTCQFRMGLNTGFVVVGSIGDNLRMDYTAVGDTTNLAARLQQVAEPGTILISDTTRRLVQGHFHLEALPPSRSKARPTQ